MRYNRFVSGRRFVRFEAAEANRHGRYPGVFHLAILDAHGVGWVRLDSDAPGEILYEDSNQVVAVQRAGSKLGPSTARLV